MSGSASNRSEHPVDQLIRELLHSGRSARDDEIESIRDRMATVPFNTQLLRVPRKERGLVYRGRMLGSREESLFVHLVRRIVVDEQWRSGTTAADYLGDLRSAIRDPAAHLVLYEPPRGAIAAALAPSSVPRERQGINAEPWLFVLYAVDRGRLISGYQASSPTAINIPEDARWLK